jgi:mannose-1-phosphate guanylyltransferase
LISTFVLVASAARLLELGRHHVPDLLDSLEPVAQVFGHPEATLLCDAVYEDMPWVSISSAILERGVQFGVLPIPELMWRDAAIGALAALA